MAPESTGPTVGAEAADGDGKVRRRATDEWGDVYSMVMTDSCGAAAECHDRMPVLLTERDWDAWMGGSAAEAKALCVPYAGPVAVDRTGELWAGAS